MATTEAELPPAGYLTSEVPIEVDGSGNPKLYLIKGVHELGSVYELKKRSLVPAIWKGANQTDKEWPYLPITFAIPELGGNISGLFYLGARDIEVVPPTVPITTVKTAIWGRVVEYHNQLQNPCNRWYSPDPNQNQGYRTEKQIYVSTDNGVTQSLVDTLYEGTDFPCNQTMYASSTYGSWVRGGPNGSAIATWPYIYNLGARPTPVRHPWIIQTPPLQANIKELIRLENNEYLITLTTMTFWILIETDAAGNIAKSYPTTTITFLTPFDRSMYFDRKIHLELLKGITDLPCTWSSVISSTNQHGENIYYNSGKFYAPETPAPFYDAFVKLITPTMLLNDKIYNPTYGTHTVYPIGGSYLVVNMTVKGKLNETTGVIEIQNIQRIEGYRTESSYGHSVPNHDSDTISAPFPTGAPTNITSTSGPDICGTFDGVPCLIERGSHTPPAVGCLPYHSEFTSGRVFETRTLLSYLGGGVVLAVVNYSAPAPGSDRTVFDRTFNLWNFESTVPVLDHDPFGACGAFYNTYKPSVEANSSVQTAKTAWYYGATGRPATIVSVTRGQYSLNEGKTWFDVNTGADNWAYSIIRAYHIVLGGGRAILYSQFSYPDNKLYLFDKGTATRINMVDCCADGNGMVIGLISTMAPDQFIFRIEYLAVDRPAEATASLVANAEGMQVIVTGPSTLTVKNEGLIATVTDVTATYSNDNTYTFASAIISGNDSNILTISPALNTVGLTGLTVSYTRGAGEYTYRLVSVTDVLTTPKMHHVKWESLYSSYTVGTFSGAGIHSTEDMSYPQGASDFPPLSITGKIFSNIDISVESEYVNTISYDGGAPPVTILLSGGALPPGLELKSTGLISGILDTVTITVDMNGTGTVTYSFTATATDSDGSSVSMEYSIICVE